MTKHAVPSKEDVRAYLQKRRHSRSALPELAEIRRQLGWDLVLAKRTVSGKA